MQVTQGFFCSEWTETSFCHILSYAQKTPIDTGVTYVCNTVIVVEIKDKVNVAKTADPFVLVCRYFSIFTGHQCSS